MRVPVEQEWSADPVLLVDAMEQDRASRYAAARFIGLVAMGGAGGAEYNTMATTGPSHWSLQEATQAAASGNHEAYASLHTNAKIATVEAIYKSGHITTIQSEISADGSLRQFGQPMQAVYANSLRYASNTPQMRRRAEAEALNGQRIQDLARAGWLEDYWLVVPSLYPDDMDADAADAAGFFGATKTGVFQATTVENGVCVVQSAFVAGVAAEYDTRALYAGSRMGRHDISSVQAIYRQYGYDVQGLSVTEILATPLLIPKSRLTNGVIDVVREYDRAVGEGVFFGQFQSGLAPGNMHHYADFIEVCRIREHRLDEVVGDIAAEMMALADNLRQPIDATKALYLLVRRHALRAVAQDASIDASVFGDVAARNLEAARFYMHIGDTAGADYALTAANQTANISMCGMGKTGNNEGDATDGEGSRQGEANDLKSETSRVPAIIRCVNCKEWVNKKDVITVKSWCCPKCKYEVDICTGAEFKPSSTSSGDRPDPGAVSLANMLRNRVLSQ